MLTIQEQIIERQKKYIKRFPNGHGQWTCNSSAVNVSIIKKKKKKCYAVLRGDCATGIILLCHCYIIKHLIVNSTSCSIVQNYARPIWLLRKSYVGPRSYAKHCHGAGERPTRIEIIFLHKADRRPYGSRLNGSNWSVRVVISTPVNDFPAPFQSEAGSPLGE